MIKENILNEKQKKKTSNTLRTFCVDVKRSQPVVFQLAAVFLPLRFVLLFNLLVSLLFYIMLCLVPTTLRLIRDGNVFANKLQCALHARRREPNRQHAGIFFR